MLFKSGSFSLLVCEDPEAYTVPESKVVDPHQLTTLVVPATKARAMLWRPTPCVLQGGFLCFRA